jgi:hypothetical protein
LARAIYSRADGERCSLYATQLSLGGAFIVSLQPPAVGEQLDIVFHPSGTAPLAPIRGRVIRSQVDSVSVEKSGFEVVFSAIDDTVLASLSAALSALGQLETASSGVAERRGQPRVRTDLPASLRLGAASTDVRVVDLSMSGALVALGSSPLAGAPSLAAEVTLHFTNAEPSESFSVSSQVVRYTRFDSGVGLGLVFRDLDARTRARIEGTMLSVLIAP